MVGSDHVTALALGMPLSLMHTEKHGAGEEVSKDHVTGPRLVPDMPPCPMRAHQSGGIPGSAFLPVLAKEWV